MHWPLYRPPTNHLPTTFLQCSLFTITMCVHTCVCLWQRSKKQPKKSLFICITNEFFPIPQHCWPIHFPVLFLVLFLESRSADVAIVAVIRICWIYKIAKILLIKDAFIWLFGRQYYVVHCSSYPLSTCTCVTVNKCLYTILAEAGSIFHHSLQV